MTSPQDHDQNADASPEPAPLENALIARLDRNGRITFIYCDRKCHPTDAGVTISEHYQSEDAIAALIGGGSIRQLLPKAEDCSRYADLMGKPPEAPQAFDGTPREFLNRYCDRIRYIYLHTPELGWTAASGREPVPLADAIAWHQTP